MPAPRKKRGWFLSDRLYKTVRNMAKDYRNGRLTNKPPMAEGPRFSKSNDFIVGLLTADLAAPAVFVGTPTTATGQPYKVATVGGTPASDGDPIDLYNYHPSISGLDGDYFVAIWLNGMWYVIDVDHCPEAA